MTKSFYRFGLLLFLIVATSSAKTEYFLPVHRIDNKPYIFSEDLEKLPEISIKNINAFETDVSLFTSKISFYAGGSLIEINNNLFQMPLWIVQQESNFYIPYHGFSRIAKELDLLIVSLNPADDIITLQFIEYNIVGVSFEEKSNGSVIRIKTNTDFNLNEISSTVVKNPGEWLSMTIPGGRVDSIAFVNQKVYPPFKKIRCTQLDQSSQISFQLNTAVDDVDIHKDESNNDILVNLRVNHSENAEKIKEIRKKWLLDTIVIDPGHGGKDPGAISQNGTDEKDITLDITLRLGELIEKNMGSKVIYTRKTDVFVPLWKRTKIANESGGKVFISIHANSNGNKKVKGFETYLLRPGKSEDAISVSQRENAVIALEEENHSYRDFSTENLILATMAQNVFMQESEYLASVVQQELDKKIKSKNRGVKQSGFHVLVGASMPNVLIEVGFLSNSSEEKNLKKKSYRKKIAEGIFNALVIFKDKYENGIIQN